jgi:hypothetical protein
MTTFINLVNPGQPVNTLSESSQYISVSAHKRHRRGNHEEWGVLVSRVSPGSSKSIFIASEKVWNKVSAYGGKAIENRWSSVPPSQEQIDSAIAKLK